MTEEHILYEKLQKVHARNSRKAERYERAYTGKEAEHTFHGGWNLGYWQGRVSAIEDIMDILEDCGMKPQMDIAAMMQLYKGDSK